MTWSDFLKYSKYIAVFYGIAFVMTLIGIWFVGHSDTGWKFITTGILFACTAFAANVALGWYHSNHKSEMKMAKNVHLARQAEAQVITSDSKELQVVTEEGQFANEMLNEHMREAISEEVRKQRGY
jgi:hypothetical protein